MRFSPWVLSLVCAMPLLAEKGILMLHVQDLKGHPIAGVRFRAGAGSALATADSFGAIRLKLASNTMPGRRRNAGTHCCPKK